MNKIIDLINSDVFPNEKANKKEGARYSNIEIDFLLLILINAYNENKIDKNMFKGFSGRGFNGILKKLNTILNNKLIKKDSMLIDFSRVNHGMINHNTIKNAYDKLKKEYQIDEIDIFSPENISGAIISKLSRFPIMTLSNETITKDEMMQIKNCLEDEMSCDTLNDNIMYEYYRDSFLSKKNGVYINNAPTGFGKSHSMALFSVFEFFYNEMFNSKENNKKSAIYFTDLKSNSIAPYEHAYNAIVMFCEKYKLSLNIKSFLLSKIMYIPSQIDIVDMFKCNDILINVIEKFKGEKEKSEILKEIDKAYEIKDGRLRDDSCREIYKKIKRIFKWIINFKDLPVKDKAILNVLFPGEKILSKISPIVAFTSTAKAIIGFDTIEGMVSISEIKNSLIFIDESDKQYGIIKNLHLENLKSIDLISVASQIFFALENKRFKNNEQHSNDKIENLRKKFVNDVIVPIKKEFHINNSFYLEGNENIDGNLSVFENGISKIFVTGHKFIQLVQKYEHNVNHLVVGEQIDNNKMFVKLLNKINSAMRSFAYFMDKASRNYNPKTNYLREITKTEKIRNLLIEVGLNNDPQILELIVDYIYRRKDEDLVSLNNNSISITVMLDCVENVIFNKMTFNCDPNKIIQNLAKKNQVFLISATAKNETTVNNFNIKELRKNVNFFDMSEKIKEKINKRINDVNNKIIENSTVNIHNVKDLNYISVAEIKSVLSSFNLTDYEIKKHTEYANVMYDFIKSEKSRYHIFFLNKLIPYTVAQAIKDHVMKDFNKNVTVFPNYQHQEIKADFLNSPKRNELFRPLVNDMNGKIIVFTTINTVGAGVNIQAIGQHIINYDNYFKVDENQKDKKEFDFDSYYIEKKTNIVVSTNEKNEVDDNNEKDVLLKKGKSYIKSVDIMNNLVENDQIDIFSYETITRGISKKNNNTNQMINRIYTETNDYLHNMGGIIKQIAGRGSRTNVRPKNKNIYISSDIFEIKNISYLCFDDDILGVIELDHIINKIKKHNNIDLLDYDQMFDKNEIKNKNSSLKFEKFKNRVLEKSIVKADRQYQKIWENLREILIKKGPIFNDEDLKLYGLYEYREIFIHNKEKLNDVSFPDIDDIRDDSGISIISKNNNLRDYFNEKGYNLLSNSGNYSINKACYNDIYKGVIGERVTKYFFDMILKVELKEYYEINNGKNMFESSDYFFCKNNDNFIIGVDAKNYQLRKYNNEQYQYELLAKTGNKLVDKLNKVIIVNAFLRKDDEFSIKYGNINNENKFNVIYDDDKFKDCKVCFINGLFNENGEISDVIAHLKGIKEWMNHE